MGWVILIALAAAAGAGLWRWGGLPRAAFEPIAAALLLGIAGYALQGAPSLAGRPVSQQADAPEVDEEAILQRNSMGERFGTAGAWLGAADGAMRAGLPRSAVTYIRSGLRENPNSADLWVGLGNALIVHGGGMVSPAAVLAFERAGTLAPAHPGPPFFLGLAYAQSGQFQQARALWTELLGRTPQTAPWRADLETRLAELPE